MAAKKRVRPLRAAPVLRDSRKAARVLSGLAANYEKRRELRHLLDLADKERDRLIGRGAEVGAVHADMGREAGMTEGRIWQIVKEQREAKAAKEAASNGKDA